MIAVIAMLALSAMVWKGGLFTDWANAIWDESKAVHIKPAGIENSTLIIGTHLIHISALTEELYDIAMQSAGDSGQDKVYYKSELGGGAWCDITEANSLSSIATGYTDPSGMNSITAVDNSVIASLFFEYHTKSDGITYDLRTNAAVNIFNTSSPYELESMAELEPLKLQYDLYVNMQATTTAGIQKIERIAAFWRTDVRSEATDKSDSDLNVLQDYYTIISKEDDATDQMGAVQSVMAAVDAARRAEVFTIVENVLSDFINEAQSAMEGGLTDPDLRSALNDSLANVQAALSEQEGKRLDVGVTVLSSARYKASNDLIENAGSSNYAECDKNTSKLVDIASIEAGLIKHEVTEAELLADELMPDADRRLTSALKSGENAQYRAAEAANSAGATLRAIVADYRSTLNAARGELESFISAYTKRIVAEDSIDFIDDRLADTKAWLDKIPSGAFAEEAQTCVNNHIEFLTGLKRQLEIALGGNALDQLTQEKAALQDSYLAALDENDLTGAKAIEGQIAALDVKIEAAEDETSAKISKLEQQIAAIQAKINDADGGAGTAALEREKDILNAQLRALSATLSPSSVGSIASDLRASALSVIANGGNMDDLDNAISSLGEIVGMNFKVVFPALKDIYDAMQKKHALEGSNAFASQIKTVEGLITNNQSSYEASLSGDKDQSEIANLTDEYFASLNSGDGGGIFGGAGTGGDGVLGGAGTGGAGTGGSGAGGAAGTGGAGGAAGTDGAGGASAGGEGSSTSGGIDAGSGAGSSSASGGRQGALSGKDAIAYINALKEYADATGSDTARDIMRAEAQRQFTLGNKLVYKKLDDPAVRYLPATAVAYWKGMRYVWNNNLNESILTRGTDYYAFMAWSDRVTRSRDADKADTMDSISGFLGCVYIPGSYTEKTFECEPVYLQGSDLGILMSEEIQTMSDELLERFMQ
ncbi:MAG: hypothetical protein LBO70_04815 [Clostridiales Family XIII bacterium]|nr:hypothetical protein [Clostridiales Family XIII bacterium]